MGGDFSLLYPHPSSPIEGEEKQIDAFPRTPFGERRTTFRGTLVPGFAGAYNESMLDRSARLSQLFAWLGHGYMHLLVALLAGTTRPMAR